MSSPRIRQTTSGLFPAFLATMFVVLMVVVAGQGPLNEEFVKTAAKGDLAAVTAMIQQRVDVNSVNRNGETALMESARTGKNDVVTALINAGAKLDLQNKDGWTAIMRAVLAAQATTIKTLVGAGAKTDITNKKGETALDLAIINGTANIRPEILTTLAQAGGNWNSRTIKGEPALVYAVTSLLSDMAKAMLKAGADPNARSKRGKPALAIAAGQCTLADGVQSALALIGSGADVNARDQNNQTALELAVNISKSDYANLTFRKNCAMVVYGLTSRGADAASIGAARKTIDANIYILFASSMADGIIQARNTNRSSPSGASAGAAPRLSTPAAGGSSGSPAPAPLGVAKGKSLDTKYFSGTLPDGWEVAANDLDTMGLMTLARKGSGGTQGIYIKFEGKGGWDGTPDQEIAAFAKSQKGTPPARITFNAIPYVQTVYEAYGYRQMMMMTKKAGTKVTLTVMGDDYTKSAEVKLFLETLRLK